jgi:Ribosomal protein L35.
LNSITSIYKICSSNSILNFITNCCCLCLDHIIFLYLIQHWTDFLTNRIIYIDRWVICTRFYRGGWIRTRAGRFRHLWRKSEYQKYRYRQHVFCNATQCTLLDKMTTKYWKRRRYYVDDPYEPYHTREEFPVTRKKPLPAPPR